MAVEARAASCAAVEMRGVFSLFSFVTASGILGGSNTGANPFASIIGDNGSGTANPQFPAKTTRKICLTNFNRSVRIQQDET
jgi:hypothetical protein